MARVVYAGKYEYERVEFKPEDYEKLKSAARLAGGSKVQTGLVRIVDSWLHSLEEVPIASFDNVMAKSEGQDVPIVVCGRARSGKSFTLRAFLESCMRKSVPFLLVDTVIEHSWMPNSCNYGDAMGLKFTGESSYRVVFDTTPRVMQLQMNIFFDNLNSLKLDGRLKRYVIAVEESHRFVDNRPVYDFVAEAGKWTRKTVVVASNPDMWKNVAIPMRPYPKPVP